MLLLTSLTFALLLDLHSIKTNIELLHGLKAHSAKQSTAPILKHPGASAGESCLTMPASLWLTGYFVGSLTNNLIHYSGSTSMTLVVNKKVNKYCSVTLSSSVNKNFLKLILSVFIGPKTNAENLI